MLLEKLYSHLGKEKLGSITHIIQQNNPQQFQRSKCKNKIIQAGEISMRKFYLLPGVGVSFSKFV